MFSRCFIVTLPNLFLNHIFCVVNIFDSFAQAAIQKNVYVQYSMPYILRTINNTYCSVPPTLFDSILLLLKYEETRSRYPVNTGTI